MQAPWTKVCGKDQGTGKEVCYTTRDFGQAADQPPNSRDRRLSDGERGTAHRSFSSAGRPVAEARLSSGDRQGGADRRQIRDLLPERLLRRGGYPNPATSGALKKAQTASVTVRNQANLEVTFDLPMKDFATAFDGPAVDPKVLEQQNQELQKQLEERARLQREKLEQQQSGAPAPAAPTPVAPTPAAPAK